MLSDNDEKRDVNESAPRAQGKSLSQQFAIALELPFVMVAAVVVGGLMGFLLDRWLHTKPILMLVFGMFGFIAGVRDVLRRVAASDDGKSQP